ncbi:MAG: hypothetical protein GY771_07990, partial [bacterium]|nr:hypothetical protein [bacterium]
SLGTVEVGGVYRYDRHSGEGFPLLSARLYEDLRVPKTPVYLGLGVGYERPWDSEGAISPDIRVGLNLVDWAKVYGSFAGGAKFPDIGEDIIIEKNRTLEFGTELYFTGLAHVRACVFQDVAEGATLYDTDTTYHEEKRFGGELEVHGRLPWPIFYYDLSYSHVDSDIEGTGGDVPLLPRDWAFGRFGYRQSFLKDDLTLCAELKGHYVGKRELYRYSHPISVTPGDNGDRYSVTGPERYLLGGFFSFTIVSVEIFVDIENIVGNEEWQERLEYNLPFRTRTYVGFQWTMFD